MSMGYYVPPSVRVRQPLSPLADMDYWLRQSLNEIVLEDGASQLSCPQLPDLVIEVRYLWSRRDCCVAFAPYWHRGCHAAYAIAESLRPLCPPVHLVALRLAPLDALRQAMEENRKAIRTALADGQIADACVQSASTGTACDRRELEDVTVAYLATLSDRDRATLYRELRAEGWCLTQLDAFRQRDHNRTRTDADARAALRFALLRDVYGLTDATAQRLLTEP